MDNQKVTIMLVARAKAGMESRAKEALLDFMFHARKEAGCVLCNVHHSLDQPSEFMIYSVWESRADFEQYDKRSYMQVFFDKISHQVFDEQSPETCWELIR